MLTTMKFLLSSVVSPLIEYSCPWIPLIVIVRPPCYREVVGHTHLVSTVSLDNIILDLNDRLPNKGQLVFVQPGNFCRRPVRRLDEELIMDEPLPHIVESNRRRL